MGLLVAVMSLLLLLISVPCIVAYLINRNLTPGKPGVKPIWVLAGELCLIGIMVVSFWIGTAGERALGASWQSRENLKAISAALIQYSEDWDDTLPPANHWQDAISVPKYRPVSTDGDVFTCPPDSVPCGYAINAAVAGHKLSGIEDPDQAVLLFETRKPMHNASGSETDIAPERDGVVRSPVGFCNGYVHQISRFDPKSFRWTLHEAPTPGRKL